MSGLDDEKLIEKIIGAAYEVRKRLAQGYLESTYENALIVELQMRGLFVENQVSMEVDYKGVVVGVFKADLLVEKRVIIEIKAVSQLNKIHELQLVNYLTTTHINHGILVNFGGDKFEVKRKYREYKSTR
jgi:GxxExxY protein